MAVTPNDPYSPHLFDKVPGEWWDDAACKGEPTDWFFPPARGVNSNSHTALAKQVCDGCPVRQPCLVFAETEPIERWGVWGGLTPTERRELRRSNKTNSNKGAKP